MRHTLFHRFARHSRPIGRAGTAAIAALAASAWIAPAMAQPMPGGPMGGPPGQSQEGAPHGPMGGPGMMGHHGMHHGHHHGRGPFGGLVFPREDKQLTTAEVQRIAEAFLLWQGERNWKVAQLREAANNTVEFAVTTAEGSVVARFSMDRKTGRPRRIG